MQCTRGDIIRNSSEIIYRAFKELPLSSYQNEKPDYDKLLEICECICDLKAFCEKKVSADYGEPLKRDMRIKREKDMIHTHLTLALLDRISTINLGIFQKNEVEIENREEFLKNLYTSRFSWNCFELTTCVYYDNIIIKSGCDFLKTTVLPTSPRAN